MASPDNDDANNIFFWLATLIFDYVEIYELGEVRGSRMACKLDELNAPEPDILFVPKNRKHQILRGRIEGPPALVVEIVSPDSVERDYHKKRQLYEKFGIEEYWIIDEPKRTATFLRLDSRGKYGEVPIQKGVFRSKALKGFWIRLHWLWPETRPKKTKALSEILAKKKRGKDL
jgi:Uma2 family endonuclease